MKDFVVSVDVIDGYSKFVDESMKSNALSNSDQNDFVYSSDNNPQLKDDKQLKDDQ